MMVLFRGYRLLEEGRGARRLVLVDHASDILQASTKVLTLCLAWSVIRTASRFSKQLEKSICHD